MPPCRCLTCATCSYCSFDYINGRICALHRSSEHEASQSEGAHKPFRHNALAAARRVVETALSSQISLQDRVKFVLHAVPRVAGSSQHMLIELLKPECVEAARCAASCTCTSPCALYCLRAGILYHASKSYCQGSMDSPVLHLVGSWSARVSMVCGDR